ncbi:GDP-mannose 4,6-dehydratase [bacterium]|nr:GDP-mannose 4,6-dehydratase [bacterium]
MRPRAVVAGGAGFLGYHFVKHLLSRDFDVVVLDNYATGTRRNAQDCSIPDRCDFIQHDICKLIDVAGPVDYVVNLACPASPVDFDRIPIEIMRACSEGTRNLLELALRKGAGFLQASTSEIYGDPEVHPQCEDYTGNVNIIGPRAVYDEGKRYAEALCFAFHRKYRVPVHIARIFNTYGPRMRSDDGRVVSNFCMQALTGQPLTIYGGGRQTRSFVYCEDEVDGLYQLMTSEHTGPINIGNPTETSIRDFAELVLELTGSKSELCDLPLLHEDDPKRRRPDISRARELLDWEPKTDLRTGIERTLEWFRELI